MYWIDSGNKYEIDNDCHITTLAYRNFWFTSIYVVFVA